MSSARGSSRPGQQVDEVLDPDQYTDVRLDRAQHRQLPAGQVQIGQLDQRVAEALGAGAGVAGAAACRGDGLQGGGDLLAADRIQGEAAGEGAVGVLTIESDRPSVGSGRPSGSSAAR